MKLFINHTNHISSRWGEDQLNAAKQYGEIQDMPFPAVDPSLDEVEVHKMAEAAAEQIINLAPAVVLCQGEFTYTFNLVELLKEAGITVLSACSERVTIETVEKNGNTRRESSFRFVRFRKY